MKTLREFIRQEVIEDDLLEDIFDKLIPVRGEGYTSRDIEKLKTWFKVVDENKGWNEFTMSAICTDSDCMFMCKLLFRTTGDIVRLVSFEIENHLD